MTLKLERATTWTQKRLKLGMVPLFDPRNMCANVERITAKTGCTSCTNWTISFKLSTRVLDENSSVSKAFHFSRLILTQYFCLLSTCTIQSHILKFEPFLTSFAIFHAFNDLFWAKWPCNWKALQLNSEKVETWKGIIIWPT